MADQDMRTEDEKIQAMFEQNTEMWSPPKEDKNVASPQADRNQNLSMNKMNDSGNGQDMFNPMMNMNMNNPLMYQQQQQQLQMQQFMMQQMQQNQHMQPGIRQQGQLPPESQPPPAGYVCYKCNQPGHWIYYCPNVPKGVHVRASNNAMQSTGMQAPPMMQVNSRTSQLPLELVCRIDNKLMKDAVLVPCCGKSFCRECIKSSLASNPRCPSCGSTDVDANRLIPNRSLRNSIQKYKDEHGDPEDQPAPEPVSAPNPIQEPTSNGDTALHDTTEKTDDKPLPTAPHQQPAQQKQQRQYPSSGMPIQVFQSEERVQKNKPYNKPDDGMASGGDPNMMGYNNGGGDMNWMNMMGMPPNMMGMPPGMNPAMMAGMMGMGIPPPGAFPGFFPPGGFPPFPPPDMFGFPGNMSPGRGGFNGGHRGNRGGGRGGMRTGPPRRRSEGGASAGSRQDIGSPAPVDKKDDASGEDIPTGPRADHSNKQERYASRSPQRHASSERSAMSPQASDRHHSSSRRYDSHSSRDRHLSRDRHSSRDAHSSSRRSRSRSRSDRRSRSPSRRSRSPPRRRSRSPSGRSATPTGPRRTEESARQVDSVVESVLDDIVFDEEPPSVDEDRKERDHDRDRDHDRRSRERSSHSNRSHSRHHGSRDRDRDRDRDSHRRHRSSDRHSRPRRSHDRR